MIDLRLGDCLEVLKTLSDDSVDSIVTDPPAGIAFMGKDWDKNKGGRDEWIKWLCEVMTEAKRVLKPGGHALVWSLPRTSHWTALALEDAGFEIRDSVIQIFGSGFPKSHDVSKAIDKLFNAEREVVGIYQAPDGANRQPRKKSHFQGDANPNNYDVTAPATEAAKQFSGWGSSLKPAHETWWLCRKPLSEKSIAENVLKHGVGGINIDGCRIQTDDDDANKRKATGDYFKHDDKGNTGFVFNHSRPATLTQGRFPANVILDDSDCVRALFPDTVSGGGRKNEGGKRNYLKSSKSNSLSGNRGGLGVGGGVFWDSERQDFYTLGISRPDNGSAARFFYCAKASPADRNEGLDGFELKELKIGGGKQTGFNPVTGEVSNGYTGIRQNHHPTVKNTNLMRYLCRLITPPGGVILDCFMGSGSTGKAAMLEGFRFIGIEQNPEYLEIARARIEHAQKQAKQLELKAA